MSRELEDVCTVRVKFSEIDAMRVAWHGSYVAYLEDGRESFGRHYPGIGYDVMLKAGILAPVYDVHMRYFASLRMGDEAEIHTFYVPRRGARLDYRYEIYRASDHELCLRAETTQLFIDAEGALMPYAPDYYVEWKRRFVNASSK